MRDRQGFTLVELADVLVVIGLLAAIAIPSYESMRIQAREAAAVAAAHTVQVAAEDFAAAHGGVYSDQEADIRPRLPGGGLLENAFTGGATEPQFGIAAATPGQVGLVTVVEHGLAVGYTVTAFGQGGLIAVFTSGQ